MNSLKDTIVALATPNGSGAVAMIRLSGEEAIKIADSVFEPTHQQKRLIHQKSHTIHLGMVKGGKHSIDQALFSIFKAPHSYTGENVVEVSCHGSVFIQQQIIELLIKKGARMAEPGEYTLRAFLNGKMDLSQAEAVADLIAANSEAAHQTALSQMRGGFSKELKTLRKELIHFVSLLELELDFSTEEVEFADRKMLGALLEKLSTQLKYLSDSFSLGNVMKEGVPVAIIGAPNTGKSTLLNALLNEDRAIVSNIAGTTRDAVEDEIVLHGIRYRFIDTAGIRATKDEIEKIGIQKTFEKIKKSSIVLYLIDAEKVRVKEEGHYLNEIKRIVSDYPDKKIIILINKSDLQEVLPPLCPFESCAKTLCISAKNKTGIPELINELIKSIERNTTIHLQTIVTNTRHYEALIKALKCIAEIKAGLASKLSNELLALDVREALNYMGQITGEIDIDNDILGTIFGKFCIGK